MSTTSTNRSINSNAGWCWFQGERAIAAGGQLFVGSVASGPDGDGRAGNVEVTQVDTATGETHVAILASALEEDDHNAPALYLRHDGRLLASYSKHSTDRLARWRVSERPLDVSDWGPEQTLETGDGYCYNNVFALGTSKTTGRVLLNFHRGLDRNPNYLVSADDGLTWRYGGKLMAWRTDTEDSRSTSSGGSFNSRPYLRYAPGMRDGRPDGTIHFIATEDHPRGYDNSVYHGVVMLIDGVPSLCATDGTPITELAKGPEATVQPNDFTQLFVGNADAVAWTVDLRVDSMGHPHALFSTRRGDANVRHDSHAGGDDLRYHHARWDGSGWHETEIAHAGTALYSPEVDYPGLAVLDPTDPFVAVISTNAHPNSGAPLISDADGQRHYEIFRSARHADGDHWDWVPLTRNSTADQIRPLLAPDVSSANDSPSPALWLSGRYSSYTDYDLSAVMSSARDGVDPSERKRFAGRTWFDRSRLRLRSRRLR